MKLISAIIISLAMASPVLAKDLYVMYVHWEEGGTTLYAVYPRVFEDRDGCDQMGEQSIIEFTKAGNPETKYVCVASQEPSFK